MSIEKIIKPSKNYLIATVIFFVAALGCFIASYIIGEQKPSEVSAYHDLIAEAKDEEGKYVSLDIVSLPYGIAEETDNSITRKYYFVFDKENYMYIVRLTDDTYNKLEKMYKEDEENFKYHLEGYIYSDPSELKRLAVEAYNEAVEEEYRLTIATLAEYVGVTYLDEEDTPYDNIITALIVFGMLSCFVFVVLLICYGVLKLKAKKVMKKWNMDEVNSEFLSSDIERYKKQNIYLTKKYVISSLDNAKIIPYENLVWVYKEVRRQNGIKVGAFIIAYTKDKKRHTIAMTRGNEDVLLEIMAEIHDKNKDVLVGYTKENRASFRELPKIKEN